MATDNGIWRRIMLVPFTVTIPDSEQDKELIFEAERGNVGNLSVGCEGLFGVVVKDGLQAPFTSRKGDHVIPERDGRYR